MFLGTKHGLREGHGLAPSPWPSRPTQKTCLGEREQMVGLVTQRAATVDTGKVQNAKGVRVVRKIETIIRQSQTVDAWRRELPGPSL